MATVAGRAFLINEDNAGELTVLNLHFQKGGYTVPAGDKPLATLMEVVNTIMPTFGK